MTVSTTRCCTKHSLAAGWRALCLTLALIGGVLACGMATTAQAAGIDVRKAALSVSEEGYLLEAEFDIQLTPLLDDVLHKGVPLYFTLEFEVMRPRWYWTNEKIVELRHPQRLSFNTLTRQYRVGAGALYQNFPTPAEALGFMSRVRRREELEAGVLRKGVNHPAALRLRLDAAQLPKLFQINNSRDWNIGSDWFRWTVTP